MFLKKTLVSPKCQAEKPLAAAVIAAIGIVFSVPSLALDSSHFLNIDGGGEFIGFVTTVQKDGFSKSFAPSGPIGAITVATFQSPRESSGSRIANPIKENTKEQAKTASTKKGSGCPQPDPTGGTNEDLSTGNPVTLSSGEKYKDETDFSASGQYGLSHARTYRSGPGYSQMFGTNWLSNLSYPKLVFGACQKTVDFNCVRKYVRVTDPDGTQRVYNYIPNTDPFQYTADGSLEAGSVSNEYGSDWVLERDGRYYTYSSTGWIKWVKDRYGNTLLSFTYDPTSSTQVIRVTNLVGQFVSFSWQSGRVVAVTDPAANQWSYAYNSNGMLSSVTSPGTQPDIREYLYESQYSPTYLTGIRINGTRYSTYSYYSDGRVQESGLAGGEERETFTYTSSPQYTTTVTSATGQQVTYQFIDVLGAKKLASQTRASTASCSSGVAAIAYNSEGYIDYKLDWNGIKTMYRYAGGGRIAQISLAPGTSAAGDIANTWDASNLLLQQTYYGGDFVAYAKRAYTYVS